MHAYDDPLTTLTARVRGGDLTAVAPLRAALEPHLTSVVQQVLRVGPSSSALDRRIARELARSERAHPGEPRDRQALATQVARRLCAAVLNGLRSNPRGPEGLRDTVREL